MYTLLYLKWITNKDQLHSRGNFGQSYAAAWMLGEFEESGYMYIYMAESLLYSLEIITTLLISYIPIEIKS